MMRPLPLSTSPKSRYGLLPQILTHRYFRITQFLSFLPEASLVSRISHFKATLDEYVNNGGTLIVFAQPYGYHFSVLPVPEEQDGTFRPVNGYGWEEDQNCLTNAVYLDGWHQIFAGQSRSTPTMNVDGYFTAYPSSASVLLRRTVNGQPAMLVYPHGQGRVIVTSMYSDFAFGQSQTSTEGGPHKGHDFLGKKT